MLEFLEIESNQPFVIAILLMFGIAIVEGVATILWGGASQLIDSLLPEIDVDVDLDVDVDSVDTGVAVDPGFGADGPATPEAPTADAGLLTPILAWLQVGRVPILVLLVIFLTSFGLAGLFVQAVVRGLTGGTLPSVLAAVPAILVALPTVRGLGGVIGRILPKEETTAVSRETFVGRVATIVIGTARAGQPAQARLRDQHGRSHYVMVEPDIEGEAFETGQEVLLVRSAGPRFRVIHPPSSALLSEEETPNR